MKKLFSVSIFSTEMLDEALKGGDGE